MRCNVARVEREGCRKANNFVPKAVRSVNAVPPRSRARPILGRSEVRTVSYELQNDHVDQQ